MRLVALRVLVFVIVTASVASAACSRPHPDNKPATTSWSDWAADVWDRWTCPEISTRPFVVSPNNRLQAIAMAQEAASKPAVACAPGTAQFGHRDFIEYLPGCGPIVFSAPHGGALKPSDIPDRTSGTTVTDSYTEELARELRDELIRITAADFAPHVIINRLARIKLDANREIVEAAQGNKDAEQAWYDYHAFIDEAKAQILQTYGAGLYIDVHGHGHEMQWVEVGYLLTSAQLQLTDDQISRPAIVEQVSIRNLADQVAANRSMPFSELLRGPRSFGGYLQRKYDAVPGPVYADPGLRSYFSGGYNTERHGSVNGGKIDGLQIELPQSVRFVEADRKVFVQHLAASIIDYYNQYWTSSYSVVAHL